jgi:hypothetical protein
MAIDDHLDNWAARTSRRTVRLRRLSAAMLALAVGAWAVCGLSYLVEWSRFTASTPHLRPPAPGSLATPMPGSTMLEEREETHVMLGHGGVFVYRLTVYTGSFSQPFADLNSRNLAWATLDRMYPPWPPWRFEWYAGPLWGIRLWVVAAAATVGWGGCVWLRRRIVPAGHCARCRYDLRGLVSRADGRTICPECGSVSDP